jgi:hypothetical protein
MRKKRENENVLNYFRVSHDVRYMTNLLRMSNVIFFGLLKMSLQSDEITLL